MFINFFLAAETQNRAQVMLNVRPDGYDITTEAEAREMHLPLVQRVHELVKVEGMDNLPQLADRAWRQLIEERRERMADRSTAAAETVVSRGVVAENGSQITSDQEHSSRMDVISDSGMNEVFDRDMIPSATPETATSNMTSHAQQADTSNLRTSVAKGKENHTSARPPRNASEKIANSDSEELSDLDEEFDGDMTAVSYPETFTTDKPNHASRMVVYSDLEESSEDDVSDAEMVAPETPQRSTTKKRTYEQHRERVNPRVLQENPSPIQARVQRQSKQMAKQKLAAVEWECEEDEGFSPLKKTRKRRNAGGDYEDDGSDGNERVDMANWLKEAKRIKPNTYKKPARQ